MLPPLVVMILINNKLGVDHYGTFVFYMSIVGLIAGVFSVRSGETVVRILGLKSINRKALLSVATAIDFLIFILVLTIGIPISFILASLLNGSSAVDNTLLVYLTISLAAPILSGTPSGVLLFEERYDQLSFIRLVSPLIRLAFLIKFSTESFELVDIATLYLWSSILGLVTCWLVLTVVGHAKFGFFRTSDLFLYARELKKIYASLVLKSTIQNADSIIIGFVAGSEKVGVFNVAKLLLQPMNLLLNPFGRMIYPKFIKLTEDMQFAAVVKSIKLYSTIFVCISVFVFLCAALFEELIFKTVKIYLWNDPILVFYLFIQTLTLAGSGWWFRSFSLSVNPNYSIVSALITALYTWSVSLAGAVFFGLAFFVALMSGFFIIRSILFWKILLSYGVRYEK